MAINATNKGVKRELIPSGNYFARCYQMIELGTIKESFQGEEKLLHKVRIGWELPTEKKVFSEERGEQPCVISKEYTLSMNEKATLRKMLASWRGKDFTEAEAKSFDITKLLGVACMLNIIEKPSAKDASVVYNEIASVSPMIKGMECPSQVNPSFVFELDNFDKIKFELLPDFIKDKIKTSEQYAKLKSPTETHISSNHASSVEEDEIPF
jgi:hypothetical protein